MQDPEILKAEIKSSLGTLPPSGLQTLADFAAFLQTKNRPRPPGRRKIIKLGGLWKNAPEITEEDIADARREMWGDFGDRRP